jgi:hypothetical protein
MPTIIGCCGGEPPDETVGLGVCSGGSSAVASRGTAEAVGAGRSIQSQKGTAGCLAKPDAKAAVQQLRDLRRGQRGRCPESCCPANKRGCAGTHRGAFSTELLGPETEIRAEVLGKGPGRSEPENMPIFLRREMPYK